MKGVEIISCKLLSFDTSTDSTGYALFESGELSEYGLINLEKINNTDERIKAMILSIYRMIEIKKPEIIVVEMTVVSRNAQAQRSLTMILGAIAGKCYKDNIFFYMFRPTEWRKLVNIPEEKLPRKREELKKWSLRKVEYMYSITDINDDVSDAILVGKAYINKFS